MSKANPTSAPARPVAIQAGSLRSRLNTTAPASTKQTSIPALVFSLNQPASSPANAMPAAMSAAMRAVLANGCCK